MTDVERARTHFWEQVGAWSVHVADTKELAPSTAMMDAELALIAAVRAEERERCAGIVGRATYASDPDVWNVYPAQVIAAIRGEP